MGFTKGHARNTASDSAKVDRVEAAEKAVLPRSRGLGRLRVDVLTRASENVIETVLPFVEVVVVDRTVVVGVSMSWVAIVELCDKRFNVKECRKKGHEVVNGRQWKECK